MISYVTRQVENESGERFFVVAHTLPGGTRSGLLLDRTGSIVTWPPTSAGLRAAHSVVTSLTLLESLHNDSDAEADASFHEHSNTDVLRRWWL